MMTIHDGKDDNNVTNEEDDGDYFAGGKSHMQSPLSPAPSLC